MTRSNTIRIGFFRVMALALLAASAAFTFPESHYSIEKTFVKAPAPQAEICSLLADDLEDSNDYSTGVHFFNDFVAFQTEFPSVDIVSINTLKVATAHSYQAVYIKLRQLLI